VIQIFENGTRHFSIGDRLSGDEIGHAHLGCIGLCILATISSTKQNTCLPIKQRVCHAYYEWVEVPNKPLGCCARFVSR
jgi:hypothetical protein